MISKIKRGASVFLILALLPISSHCKPIELPDCAGPGCQRTATSAEWPAPLTDSAYEVVVQQYMLQLPSMPKRIVQESDGELLIFGQDGSSAGIKLITSYTEATKPSVLDRIPQKSNFAVAEAGKLVFTKTITDTPPTDQNDLFIWRQSMFLKSQVFNESNSVHVSQKKDLTAFYFEPPDMEGSSMAYIFDSNNSGSYLKVYAEGVTFNLFKRLVGAIQLRGFN